MSINLHAAHGSIDFPICSRDHEMSRATEAIARESQWRQVVRSPQADIADITISRWEEARSTSSHQATTPEDCYFVAIALKSTRAKLTRDRQVVFDGTMRGNAEAEVTRRRSESRDRALVSRDEVPRALEEGGSLRRQPHRARRAFEQAMTDAILEPLQLHADRPLRSPQSLCGAREAVEIRHHHKSPDGIDIEREHSTIRLCCL